MEEEDAYYDGVENRKYNRRCNASGYTFCFDGETLKVVAQYSMVVAGDGDDRDPVDMVSQYNRMLQYGGDDLCDGNCRRLARSPRTVIDDVSVGSEDSPLIVEEGMTFETAGETDEDPYSSFETIGWEIVE